MSRRRLLLRRQLSRPKPRWLPLSHLLHTAKDQRLLPTPNSVLTILQTSNPVEPALDPILPFLSPRLVSTVLRDPPSPQLGFRFFIWASNYARLRSWVSRALVLDHLVGADNGVDLFWETLKDVKDCNFNVPLEAFSVFIQGCVKLDMAERALEAFGLMRDFGCDPNIYIYNMILHLVMRKEAVSLGLAVYNMMLKLDCSPNEFTFNLLIDGLCKSGEIDCAQEMFSEMTERGIGLSTVIYTILISGLCRAKRADDALRLFRSMKERGCSPDTFTYNVLLHGFCKIGRMDEAFAILGFFEKDGYEIDLFGYSCLIEGLFIAERFNDAREWFEKMIANGIKPDVVAYTIMIKGLSKEGNLQEALKLLYEMTDRNIMPDSCCYNALIRGFCKIGALDSSRSLQLEISKHDGFPSSQTYTIIICGLCKNGMIGEAQEIFVEMEKLNCSPSVATFNVLIDGLCKAGGLKRAQLLFHKMEVSRKPSVYLRLSQGLNRVLDGTALHTMVENYCDSGLVHKAYNLLLQLAESGVVPDIVTYNVLINGYCRANDIDRAVNLFNGLQYKGLSPDSVTYGTLINGLQRADRKEEAFRYMALMSKSESVPVAIYRSLMTWSCRRKDVPSAFNLWLEYLKSSGRWRDEVLKEIQEQFNRGEVEKAVRGLLEMDFRLKSFQLAPYTILLIGLCQAGKVEDALRIFMILKESEIIVTSPSCVKLIFGLCKEGKLDLAVDVFLYTVEKGYRLRPTICNQLLKSLLRSKDEQQRAFYLLHRMKYLGYDLDNCLHRTTKFQFRACWTLQEKQSRSLEG